MTNAAHFSGKVAVKGIIEKDGRILITRSVRDPDTWDFPGGRIHENEALEDALLREIMEEVGVDATIQRTLCSEQMLHISDGKTILFVTFLLRLSNPSQEIALATGDMEEKRWVGKEDFSSIKFFAQCLKPLKTLWNIA